MGSLSRTNEAVSISSKFQAPPALPRADTTDGSLRRASRPLDKSRASQATLTVEPINPRAQAGGFR